MPRLHRLAGSARVGPSTFASEPLALEQVYARGRDAGRSDGHAPIAAALHVPVGRTSILVSSLYMACAIAQPTAGKLAEEFGPRRVFLILKTLEIGHFSALLVSGRTSKNGSRAHAKGHDETRRTKPGPRQPGPQTDVR